jgi:hypothetical protein
MARVSYPDGWFSAGAETNPTIVRTDFAQDGIDPFMDVTFGSITMNGYLCEVRGREITTNAEYVPTKRGISVVGRRGFWHTLCLDAGHEDYEWVPIRPRWVQNVSEQRNGLDTSEQCVALEPEENLDDAVPVSLISDTLLFVRQIRQRFWCFAVGRYSTEGGRLEACLLLERVDETKGIYRRVGYTQSSVEGSMFDNIGAEQRRTITLI